MLYHFNNTHACTHTDMCTGARTCTQRHAQVHTYIHMRMHAQLKELFTGNIEIMLEKGILPNYELLYVWRYISFFQSILGCISWCWINCIQETNKSSVGKRSFWIKKMNPYHNFLFRLELDGFKIFSNSRFWEKKLQKKRKLWKWKKAIQIF